jgi:hypothetical protein
MSGNEGSRYTKTAKTLPQAGSVTQPVSASMSRSRVFALRFRGEGGYGEYVCVTCGTQPMDAPLAVCDRCGPGGGSAPLHCETGAEEGQN